MKKLSVLLLAIGLSLSLSGQGFKADVILGFTAAQIEGDNLAGYDKLGLTGGLSISRDFKDNWFGSMELLFVQKGSQSQICFGCSDVAFRLNLNYIEIPISFGIKDWYIEDEDYYKVYAEVGMAYGYLFGVSSSNQFFEDNADRFKTSDFSLHFSVGYQFTPRWKVSIKYTNSPFRIYEDMDNDIDAFKSYLWALRFHYVL